jgi:hypothetical protein
MRPVIRERLCGGSAMRPRFPAAFRLPPFASWPSFPATDIRFPYGLPTGGWSAPPDHDGVSMFHTGEMRPVPGAPYTPGPWCSHGRHRNFDHHCHLPAAGPVLRCRFPSPGVLGNEACRGSRHSPFRSSPLPVTDGWNTGPWAFSRASHPAVASDACQERGRALSTRSELTVDIRPSMSVFSLNQCDLMSHLDPPVVSDVVV